MIRKIAAAAATCFLSSFSLNAYAIDGVSLELGRGLNDHINLARVGAEWNWDGEWASEDKISILAGYWEVSAGAWNNTTHSHGDFSVTPVFRVYGVGKTGVYVEGGIGLHVVSRHGSGEHELGTNLQFGDHFGVGVRFGERGRYDLSLRLQHLSNGNVKSPNPGIEFAIVRLQLHFE